MIGLLGGVCTGVHIYKDEEKELTLMENPATNTERTEPGKIPRGWIAIRGVENSQLIMSK